MLRETDEELLSPGKREVGPGYHLAPLLGRIIVVGVAVLLLFILMICTLVIVS